MTPEQLNAIANAPLHDDKTTFKEMFEHLVSDGFFWTNGEPPNGEEAMNAVMVKALETLINSSKG